MAAARINTRQSFFKNLDWVRCLFCFETISMDVSFYFFQCTDISCGPCVAQMKKNGGKVVCRHCNKNVKYIPIDENMPSNVRNTFGPGQEHLQNCLEAELFRQRHRKDIKIRLDEDCVKMQKASLKTRAQTQQLRVETKKYNNASRKLYHELLNEIPKERIDQLLLMSGDELERMTYDEMAYGYSTQSNKSDSSSDSSGFSFSPPSFPSLDEFVGMAQTGTSSSQRLINEFDRQLSITKRNSRDNKIYESDHDHCRSSDAKIVWQNTGRDPHRDSSKDVRRISSEIPRRSREDTRRTSREDVRRNSRKTHQNSRDNKRCTSREDIRRTSRETYHDSRKGNRHTSREDVRRTSRETYHDSQKSNRHTSREDIRRTSRENIHKSQKDIRRV